MTPKNEREERRLTRGVSEAKGAASDARGRADDARGRADAAQTTASGARTAADGAQTTASNARDAAAAADRNANSRILDGDNVIGPGRLSGSPTNGSIPKAVRGYHVPEAEFTGAHLVPASVGRTRLATALDGPEQAEFGFRKIFGTGSSLGAASANHSHSISFKELPRAARRFVLGVREKVRRRKGSEGEVLREEVEELRALVLALAHLAFDDEDLTAEDREALLQERSPEGRAFRRKYMKEHKFDFGDRIKRGRNIDGEEGARFRPSKRHTGGGATSPHPDVTDE